MKINFLFLISAFCFSQALAYPLPHHATKTYECNDCDKLSHENLHTNWDVTKMSSDGSKINANKSYSYNQTVTAIQLKQGITLSTRAPGAVIRITPLQKKSIPDLEIKTPQNQLMALKNAAILYAADDDLDESLRTAKHQTMLQIKPELGFGTFIIKSKQSSSAHAKSYSINVFDKFSLIYLQVEPRSLHYQYGDQFSATISLKDYDNEYSIDDVSANLIGTNEEVLPLKISQIKRNQFQASTTLLSELNTYGANWYIEAEVISIQEEGIIRRTARAAFSYSIPSASLINIKKVSSRPLTFTATVEVAKASRYALQSVLFHQNASGKLVPMETSQISQWLEPGKQTIKFSFDNSQHLAEDTLSLGYLHLTDYGQLKTVYQYNPPIKLKQLMD